MYRDRDHQLTESCPESEYSRPGGFAGNVDADGPASTESTEVPVELGSEFAMPVKHVDVRSAHSLGHPSPGACQEVYPTIDQRMDEIKSNIWSGTPSYSAPCSYQKPSYTVFRLQLRSPQCQDPEKINAGNDALQTARSRSTMCQAVAIPRRAEAPRAVTEPRRSTRFSDDWSLEFESSTSINHHADQSGLSRTDAGADDEPSSPADEQDMSLGSGIEASSSSFWDEHETHGYRSHNRNTARASRMASYGRTRDKGRQEL
ncbi:GL27112 [Drosophila persimilis]|uniref:GL27112 n=1 Tax=Drosophila persimilis TaxID=7234 RepID=B4HAQ8_DROPE|nr:GL27112 [Drosophila persimilis]